MITMARIIFVLLLLFSRAVYANGPTDSEVYSLTVGKEIKLNETTTGDLTFGKLVKGSYRGNEWELTTNDPISVSLSYNTRGSISAKYTPIVADSGFVLTGTRVYPSKIIFSTENGPGVLNRIFKFYPIVKVHDDTLPGAYTGTIEFTILAL